MAPHDQRSKQVLTVLGAITIRRPYYVCSDCGKSRIPRDQELDIVGTKFSPGLRRMMAVVGSETSFEKGSEQLQVLAGIEVVPKAIQTHAEAIGTDIAASLREEAGRAKQLQFPEILHKPVPILYIEMDGTGIPVVKSETEGRSGRQDRCNWNIASRHFPDAMEIVDLYHARQHVWKLSGKLFPSSDARRKGWAAGMQSKLDRGEIESLVASLRRLAAKHTELAQIITNEADYFQRNANRMRYPEFRRHGLFVGSGVV